MRAEVVVIGAGLAGLTAAVRLAESGRNVLLISKGIGSTHLSSGTIDPAPAQPLVRLLVFAVRIDRGERVVDAAALFGCGSDQRCQPFAARQIAAPQVQHRADCRECPVAARAIAFVEHEHLGDFHQTRFRCLNLVSGFRSQHHDGRICRLGNVQLALPDTDGLEQDDIEGCSVEDIGHIDGLCRKAAERLTRRHAADEHPIVAPDLRHANPITEQRAAAEWAGRVDRDHRNGLTTQPQGRGEPCHERRFARAWRPGHADAIRPANPGTQSVEQLGRVAVVSLDEVDRLGDRASLAAHDRPRKGRHRQ